VEPAPAELVQGEEVEYVLTMPGEGGETEVFFSDLSPEYARFKANPFLEQHTRAIEAAGAARVRIGAGSDAGSPLTPHGSLIDELMALADTGFSPLEALRCATCKAARIIGLDSKVGNIEPGFVADLILVPQNPLEDLECLRDVRAVWIGGRLVYSRFISLKVEPSDRGLTLQRGHG
jgi:imidazolonepropionase-like amidohydrolase